MVFGEVMNENIIFEENHLSFFCFYCLNFGYLKEVSSNRSSCPQVFPSICLSMVKLNIP